MSVNNKLVSGKDGSNTFTFFKGRVALYAILESIGIEKGDEIIMPAFTCVVVPNVVTYLGATPVYVDISERTYNIDTDLLEQSITPKTKAVIVQHTFGIPAEMDRIMDIAKKHGLYIVEDCCHSLGSKYRGMEVGTIGDASFFSSQWSKPVTTGLGGWAVVNNPEITGTMKKKYASFIEPANKEIMLLRLQYYAFSLLLNPRTFWTLQSLYRTLSGLGIAIGSSGARELENNMPPNYKMKMSGWQRKLLSEKLDGSDKIIEHRKWAASQYDELAKENSSIVLELPDYIDAVFLRYPVQVQDKKRVLEEAKKRSIELGDWFLSPVHPNLSGWENVKYTKGSCKRAEYVCRHVINLPTHMKIGEREILDANWVFTESI